jgi:hypothetical protein
MVPSGMELAYLAGEVDLNGLDANVLRTSRHDGGICLTGRGKGIERCKDRARGNSRNLEGQRTVSGRSLARLNHVATVGGQGSM